MFKCGVALIDFFLELLCEAGFVRGLSDIVEFALIQPHRFVTNGAWDGSETLFHETAA
jgi:hypothetical protein